MECLRSDGCWFQKEKAPPCPHHPYRHCTLEPISYAVVLMDTTSYSDYSKFDPYLFDPRNYYKYGKNKYASKGVHKGMQGGFAMNAILRTVGLSIFLNTVKRMILQQ